MKLTIRRNQADVKGVFGGHKGVSLAFQDGARSPDTTFTWVEVLPLSSNGAWSLN